ncbi:MAG: hypothetical protein DKM50_13035 [Candidatus Margulisiibacteriota bacterium]|nr:MAG: hypothetical protein DKM50_13035 [Candidatus Margulisiibacteriota bacterium]HCY37480.1 hypothetical protein [Candidatus Margulisiibacteriota bacterium]
MDNMKRLITVSLLTFIFLSISIVSAAETVYLEGRGDQLIDKVREWRDRNPSAIVNNVSVENGIDQMPTEDGLQQEVFTWGIHLFYYVDEHNVFKGSKDLESKNSEIAFSAPGIVFVKGSGLTLQDNINKWKKTHPDSSITAAGIEVTTDQVWTDDGYIRKQIPKGMWLFFVDNMPASLAQVSTANYIFNVSDGIVFVEGAGAQLQDRVGTWKNENPALSIKGACIESFTDHIWTEEGYKRMPVTKGIWMFYEKEQTALSSPIKRKVMEPFSIAEEYLKKGIESIKGTQEFKQGMTDAQYWYDEVMKDFPFDSIISAVRLRKLHMKFLLGTSTKGNELSDIFSQYKETILELPAINDLIPIYAKNKDLINQLLLNQRIVKIYKDSPYSKEAYEAIKKIESINKEIEKKI